jgi:hypothetical protein
MLPPPILKQRIKMLNDIDFCWNSHQQASTDNWDEFYQLLLAYKAEHNGDLISPFTTPRQTGSSWVMPQYIKDKDCSPRV